MYQAAPQLLRWRLRPRQDGATLASSLSEICRLTTHILQARRERLRLPRLQVLPFSFPCPLAVTGDERRGRWGF